ncbi:catechol 2,3-dioxygenase-like lactoylglutathione lyase family enzyme [Flavobacterium sp. CG_23.5]|uniref:VOC family protein n=1 Tax=Flavobacterium sp. CG_23.5 TaxID=2760708 RepID=UPI001AE96BF0|nr:VOC family protein [Flavobacterium sp. CG_23.5]MBP2284478.1 catechol 2,3-dioxygenase-like lactoylglutathione lyase family enzyme [Flavobacterium sp. CG_23.5]
MKIIELDLLTDDVNNTAIFYNEIMGLKIISRDKYGISFAAGSTKLTFRPSENVKPVYHFAFDIPNNKLQEAFAWMEKNVEILVVIPPDKIADFYNWNAKSFYFYDNNGNIVEFIARYSLDNTSEKPFDGDSILSVSEIGFVSKNIEKLSDEMCAKYNLSVFSKQPKRDKFIVLGTDTGLFILVDENRDWYPTSIKSKSFWTKVVFYNNGIKREMEISD